MNEKERNACDALPDERYRDFIENISDGVYETDIHGNFTYFNNALCKVLGYPREAVIGENFAHFMDRKNARKAYGVFTKIWVTHEGFSDVLWEILDKDGQPRMIELSAHLVRDGKNKKAGFRGVVRDVTEKIRTQQSLRESEARYQKQYEASRRAEKRTRTLLDFVPYPMVVSRTNGGVTYVNPAFSETFGWHLDELKGKPIPYIPPGLKKNTREGMRTLSEKKIIHRFETRRLTKDGRILDVAARVAIVPDGDKGETSELLILRDITQEKRMSRDKEALLRISTALPAYPELEELLDYISEEIRGILNTEDALVILLDEEKKEFAYVGAAHDDPACCKIIKSLRLPANSSVAGKVVESGEPIIITDISKNPDFHHSVDEAMGFKTRDMIQVPLRSVDRIIGVLCARNKKEGIFDQTDVELLTLITGTVALSIENAAFSEELRKAYRDVSSLNRAKDKVINHLSHELKTPASILLASLSILSKKLKTIPEETWKPAIERARRNLERILDIQYQAKDIVKDSGYKSYGLLSMLLDQCRDELESLVADEVGEGPLVERIGKRIEELFGAKESLSAVIQPGIFIKTRLETLKAGFAHRDLEMVFQIEEDAPAITIPPDVLEKTVDGLVKNAVENTPDEGKIIICVKKKGEGTEVEVHDYGVGIVEENQDRIFEGFFVNRDTMAYSTKRPFDFNAGGKGSDLLRMKIFSERYHFKMSMHSTRCGFIPKESDLCPGRISICPFCKAKEDCWNSGETRFILFFRRAPEQKKNDREVCNLPLLLGQKKVPARASFKKAEK